MKSLNKIYFLFLILLPGYFLCQSLYLWFKIIGHWYYQVYFMGLIEGVDHLIRLPRLISSLFLYSTFFIILRLRFEQIKTHSINQYLLFIYLLVVVSSLIPILTSYSPQWKILDYVNMFALVGCFMYYVFIDYKLNPMKYSWSRLLDNNRIGT